MAIKKCRQCGKQNGDDATTCASCGASTVRTKRSKSQLGTLILGIVIFGFVGALLTAKTEKDLKSDARPECQVAMADGSKAPRACDLLILCNEKFNLGIRASEITSHYNADPVRRDDLLDENSAQMELLDARIRNYSTDDLRTVCKRNQYWAQPNTSENWDRRLAAIGKGLGPFDGTCSQSPLTAFEIGKEMSAHDLTKAMNAACLGAELKGEQYAIKWAGKNYRLVLKTLPYDGMQARYEIAGIRGE